MRILTPCAYFYPEFSASSAASKDLVDEYVRSGIVSVNYAPVPSRGISDEVRNAYKKKKYEEFRDGYVILHRFSMLKEGQNPALRALRYLLCTVKEYFLCIKENGIDEVYGGSTPPTQGMLCAMVAGRLSKKYGRRVPFVYNLQDIFPDSLVGTGLTHKGSIIWKIGRVIENFTYRHADKIIVISEDFKRNVMAKGVPEEKIEVIYNWVDENAIRPVADDENPMFEEFGISREGFRVVYAGNLGNAQNIELIVDAAARLKDGSTGSPQVIQFIIFGTGGLEQEIKLRKEREGLDNLMILPLQPYERVSQVYSLGNVCIVACKPGLGGAAMPSKTWSIMSAGRAVLANFDEGELKEIIEGNASTGSAQAPCGVFTKAGDLDGFVDAIKRLSSQSELCARMGLAGRQFILGNLTKEVGTRKYVDVIKSVVKKDLLTDSKL